MEVIAGVSSILRTCIPEMIFSSTFCLEYLCNADSDICAEIIDSVTRVAKRLNEIRESYNNVALNTTLVASQLSTIRAALEALYEWRASDQHSTGPSRQLDKDLGMSLSCCAILISVIDGKLDDSGYEPGLKQKIRCESTFQSVWFPNAYRNLSCNLYVLRPFVFF